MLGQQLYDLIFKGVEQLECFSAIQDVSRTSVVIFGPDEANVLPRVAWIFDPFLRGYHAPRKICGVSDYSYGHRGSETRFESDIFQKNYEVPVQ